MATEVKDKRIGWLRDLKIGDKVQFSNRLKQYFDYKVSKITPTGMITVENMTGNTFVFNANGNMRGVSDAYCYLQPYDKEKHDRYLINLEKYRVIKQINDINKELALLTFEHNNLNELIEIKSMLTQLNLELSSKGEIK